MKNVLKRKKRTLSSYDLNILLPVIIKGLEEKKGKTNAINRKQIITAVRNHGLKINDFSFKMLINHIRINDLIPGLVAIKSGYYISNDEQEFIDYEDSLLSREREIRKIRMSMKRQRDTMFLQKRAKQTQLF